MMTAASSAASSRRKARTWFMSFSPCMTTDLLERDARCLGMAAVFHMTHHTPNKIDFNEFNELNNLSFSCNGCSDAKERLRQPSYAMKTQVRASYLSI